MGQYLQRVSLVQSSRSIQPMQTVPWRKNFFSVFLGRTSVCITDQETQEENVLGGPTPLWVGTYTSHLLYKVQDPFSPCIQSHGQDIFSVFLGRTSLRTTDQETQEDNVLGGPTTLHLVDRYLHQLSLVQSSRSIKPMQTVPWPKHIYTFFFLKFLGQIFASDAQTRDSPSKIVPDFLCATL